jgi:hypothetical protein
MILSMETFQENKMPTKNSLINVVLEEPLYQNVRFLAKREGVSLSTKLKDLVKEALEVQEDLHLIKLGENRKRSLKNSKTLSHKEVWS